MEKGMDIFTPLEELPESVREQYEYHPEKAKQLLAEAGYPDGFKTEIVCYPAQVDLLSIVKSDWAKIGVDLKIDVKEFTVYQSIWRSRTHKEMFIGILSSVAVFNLAKGRLDYFQNSSMVNDERLNEAVKMIDTNVVVNDAKCIEVLKDVYPYIREQCWHIETPSPYLWTTWQPWIKEYHGETTVGICDWFDFPKWIWCDQDLKEEMTGKR